MNTGCLTFFTKQVVKALSYIRTSGLRSGGMWESMLYEEVFLLWKTTLVQELASR